MAKKVVKKNNLNVEEKKQYLTNRIDAFIKRENNEYFETVREKEYSIGNLFDNISNVDTLENKFFNYLEKRSDRELFELLITFDSCTDNSIQFIKTILNVIGEKYIQDSIELVSNYIIDGFDYDFNEFPNINKYSFILNMGLELGINGGVVTLKDYIITTVGTLLTGLQKSSKFENIDTVESEDTLIEQLKNYRIFKMLNSGESKYMVEYLSKLFKSFKCLDYYPTSNILCMMKISEYYDFLNNK